MAALVPAHPAIRPSTPLAQRLSEERGTELPAFEADEQRVGCAMPPCRVRSRLSRWRPAATLGVVATHEHAGVRTPVQRSSQ